MAGERTRIGLLDTGAAVFFLAGIALTMFGGFEIIANKPTEGVMHAAIGLVVGGGTGIYLFGKARG